MDYFNLHDILSKEELVCVEFPYPISFSEFLIHENKRGIASYKRISVPIFIIDYVFQNGHCQVAKDIISLEVLNDLKANPRSVVVSGVTKSFYCISSIFHPNDSQFFRDVFLERLLYFLDRIVTNDMFEEDFACMDVEEACIIKSAMEHIEKYKSLSILR